MDAEHLKRILIVDDEADVTELLDYKFKQAGYAIRTLNDPLRAIGLARDFRAGRWRHVRGGGARW